MKMNTMADTTSSIETLLTADFDSPRAEVREPLSRMNIMKRENDILITENDLLRRQLYLVKQNTGLRVANLVSDALSWLDSHSQMRYGTEGGLSNLVNQTTSPLVRPSRSPSPTPDRGMTPTRISPPPSIVQQAFPFDKSGRLYSPNPSRRTSVAGTPGYNWEAPSNAPSEAGSATADAQFQNRNMSQADSLRASQLQKSGESPREFQGRPTANQAQINQQRTSQQQQEQRRSSSVRSPPPPRRSSASPSRQSRSPRQQGRSPNVQQPQELSPRSSFAQEQEQQRQASAAQQAQELAASVFQQAEMHRKSMMQQVEHQRASLAQQAQQQRIQPEPTSPQRTRSPASPRGNLQGYQAVGPPQVKLTQPTPEMTSQRQTINTLSPTQEAGDISPSKKGDRSQFLTTRRNVTPAVSVMEDEAFSIADTEDEIEANPTGSNGFTLNRSGFKVPGMTTNQMNRMQMDYAQRHQGDTSIGEETPSEALPGTRVARQLFQGSDPQTKANMDRRPTPAYPPVAASTPFGPGTNKFQRKLSTVQQAQEPQAPYNTSLDSQGRSIGGSGSMPPSPQDSPIKPNKRIIGEIAFQLDRRILNYVFGSQTGPSSSEDRRRFYGYIIQNIPEKIVRECRDRATGQMDYHKQAMLQQRYQYALSVLQPLGYDVEVHSDLSVDLVNKYGLLPLPRGGTGVGVGPEHRVLIKDMVLQLAPKHEQQDILIMLECLSVMAEDDGKPIIIF